MKMYKKPIVTVDAGLAEGVYAASGASQGTLNVIYQGVWDRWGTNGGKGLAVAVDGRNFCIPGRYMEQRSEEGGFLSGKVHLPDGCL